MWDMNCIAVILAGGMGTRIRHILPDVPKPLALICGKPFIEWIIQFLCSQKINHILVSTGYLSDQVENFVAKKKVPKLNIKAVSEAIPLGTAGGVLNALDQTLVNCENILILNGDSLVLADLGPLFSSLEEESNAVAMLGIRMTDAVRYGTLVTKKGGLLEGFKEKHTGEGLVNAGVYLFRKHILDELPRGQLLSFENDVFPALIKQGFRIKVVEVSAPFIDIGTEESLGCATSFIEQNYKYFI